MYLMRGSDRVAIHTQTSAYTRTHYAEGTEVPTTQTYPAFYNSLSRQLRHILHITSPGKVPQFRKSVEMPNM
jgi:hypothetical protein